MAKFVKEYYDGSQESLQRYFDKTVKHLRSGKGRCADALGFCLYSNGHGNYCAVGVHIPPGPARKFQGDVSTLADEFPELKGVAFPEGDGWKLASHLQGVHDSESYWTGKKFNGEGEKDLGRIAYKFSLNYTPAEPTH